ncbi:MAG: glycosyl hydrolase family 28 protein [Polyangiaceae bacterium]
MHTHVARRSLWTLACAGPFIGICVGALVGCGGSNEPSYSPTAGASSVGSAGAAVATGGTSGSTSVGSAGASSGAGIGGLGAPAGSPAIGGSSNGGAGGAGAAGKGGSGGSGGGSGGSGALVGKYPTTCEALGAEPVIPPACATLMATKKAPGGALSDETTLDTQQIQAAIDTCPMGQAVKLAAAGDKNAFLSGALFLKNGVTLWVDTGVTLFASRNPRDFDAKANQCGLGTGGASNCFALINSSGMTGTGVMGEGTIDGRGGENVIGQTPPLTWWQMNDKTHFSGDLTAPRLVQTSGGADFTLYKVHFQNAPKFHIVIGTSGFVVWGITVITDPTSPNTDGVDPSGASNGLIAYNKISTGDDNIAIKGVGPTIDNIIVAHNHFGKGHGMSIGSETYGGVKNVKVCDLSLDGADNGLRIKSDVSRGGLVQDVSYKDVCIRAVKNPFVFDPFYSSATGTMIPVFQNITLTNVHVLSGGASTFSGYDATRPLSITLDNVVFDDPGSATFKTQDAKLTFGPGPVNFTPTGTDVTVTKQFNGSPAPLDCSQAWVTF